MSLKSIWDWSTTAGDNGAADDEINFAEFQDPSTVNDSARALMRRIKQFLLDLAPARTSGGTSSAYTVTTASGGATLRDQQVVTFLPHVSNADGALTLAVDAYGAKALRPSYSSSSWNAGEIQIGVPVTAYYSLALNAWIARAQRVNGLTLVNSSLTKTVYGASPDFATLEDASAWLEGVHFGVNGYVTFSLRAGQFALSAPVVFRNAQLDKVTIQGATMLATLSPNEFTVTGTKVAGDRTTALTLLRTKYATEIACTGANGWIGFVGGLPTVKRLLVSSDRTALSGVSGLLVFNNGAILDAVSVHGAGGHGFSFRNGFFYLQSNTCTATGCSASGFAVDGSSSVAATAGLAGCVNDVAGVHCLGGHMAMTAGCYWMGNDSGIYCTNGGGVEANGGTTLSWNTVGLNINHGDANFGVAPSFSNVGSYALYAKQARITAGASGLASGNVTALNGSIIDLTGATSAGTLSPAANTVGNANSYIKV